MNFQKMSKGVECGGHEWPEAIFVFKLVTNRVNANVSLKIAEFFPKIGRGL